jgi:hypothetical protein
MWISAIFLTQIADTLLSRKIFKTVVIRKACQSIGMSTVAIYDFCQMYNVNLVYFVAHIGSAVLLIAASYSGCDRVVTVTLLTLSVAINGAIYGGYVVNHVDLARNHAHVLSGITHTVANLTGLGVPLVAGFLLSKDVNNYILKLHECH